MKKSQQSQDMLTEKKKRQLEFWKKLEWEILTCDEASTVFPDMYSCPVCHAKRERVEWSDDLVMVHKEPDLLIN